VQTGFMNTNSGLKIFKLQNVPGHKVLATKHPNCKISQLQDDPSHRMSQIQEVSNAKRPNCKASQFQNVSMQNVLAIYCPKLQNIPATIIKAYII
jgi:hypothetical protein